MSTYKHGRWWWEWRYRREAWTGEALWYANELQPWEDGYRPMNDAERTAYERWREYIKRFGRVTA